MVLALREYRPVSQISLSLICPPPDLLLSGVAIPDPPSTGAPRGERAKNAGGIDVFEHRYGIKLKKVTANAATLKLLRKHFPNQSLSELRAKVQAHDYVFLSDMEKCNGERRMAKLLREFDKAGIETELYEEHRYTPAPWQAEPMSREYLNNILQRNLEIARQVLEDVELETVGHISSDAKTDIVEEISKMKKEDGEN